MRNGRKQATGEGWVDMHGIWARCGRLHFVVTQQFLVTGNSGQRLSTKKSSGERFDRIGGNALKKMAAVRIQAGLFWGYAVSNIKSFRSFSLPGWRGNRYEFTKFEELESGGLVRAVRVQASAETLLALPSPIIGAVRMQPELGLVSLRNMAQASSGQVSLTDCTRFTSSPLVASEHSRNVFLVR